MAIEKDLGRIATALEGILAHLSTQVIDRGATDSKPSVNAPAKAEAPEPVAVPAAQQQPAPVPEPAPAPVAPAPAAPAPAPAPAPTAPPVASEAAPAPASTMSAADLNAGIVAEFPRIGDRAKIEAVIAKYNGGSKSITGLDPAHFAAVLTEVQAL